MRSRLLVLLTGAVTGAVAMTAPSASAETGKGTLHVSATVVRSCRVSTGAPSVRVDCGAGSTAVRVVPPSASTDRVAHSDHTRVLTIEF